MATERDRRVTYTDCRLPINSNDHIIKRFYEIKEQSKNIISPLQQCLWPQNMAGWWLTLIDFYIKSHDGIITWSCKITWQTKIIIYPWQNVYVYQFHQGGDIQRGVPFYKVTLLFNHMVLQYGIKYFSCCIATSTKPMATKGSKVVTYYKKFQPIKSHNPLNTWSREVKW